MNNENNKNNELSNNELSNNDSSNNESSKNVIYKTKALLENIRCKDFDDVARTNKIKYVLLHIEKYIKEILYEIKLLIIDDGSDLPSTIPFMWERLRMNYRKKESNKKFIESIKKISSNLPDQKNKLRLISFIHKLNLQDSIDEIINTNPTIKNDNEIYTALEERSQQIKKMTKDIDGKKLKLSISYSKSNDKKNIAKINKTLQQINPLDGVKVNLNVVDYDNESKTNTKVGVFIWEFAKYYKKNVIFSIIFIYLLIRLISNSISSMTSSDADTRAEGLGQLIIGIIIIYFLYTIVRTESILPIFKVLSLCFIWGIAFIIFKYAYQFYSTFYDNCKKTPSKSYNKTCRTNTLPFQNSTIADLLLLFISFSLMMFSIRQIGRLFDYKYSLSILTEIQSFKIKEWLEQDWIIFKALVILFVVLLVNDLLKDKVSNSDPLLIVSYVCFFIAVFIAYIQYIIGNKFLEHKTSVRHLRNIGKFAHKVSQVKNHTTK